MAQFLRNVITPEMDHHVIESPSFMWATRIIDVLCTSIVGFILCHHLYAIITFRRFQSEQLKTSSSSLASRRLLYQTLDTWTVTLNIFNISFILFQFILLLLMTLNIWQVLSLSTSCNFIVTLMVTLYHLSKSIFYCILITRLQAAFHLSSLKYSNSTIILLYSFVIIYTIFVCFGTPFLIYGVWIITPVTWCHIHTYETILSSISIAVWIIFDVLISIVLMFMFIRPIKKVMKRNNDQRPTRFTALYIKYALLTYVSIILNLVSLLVYLFDHLTIFIEITAAINCVCIVLMHARYQSTFKCLCGFIVAYFTNKQKHAFRQCVRQTKEGVNETASLTANDTKRKEQNEHRISVGPDGSAMDAMKV